MKRKCTYRPPAAVPAHVRRSCAWCTAGYVGAASNESCGLVCERGEALRFGEEGAVGRGGREGKQQPKKGGGSSLFLKEIVRLSPEGFYDHGSPRWDGRRDILIEICDLTYICTIVHALPVSVTGTLRHNPNKTFSPELVSIKLFKVLKLSDTKQWRWYQKVDLLYTVVHDRLTCNLVVDS